MTIRHYLSQLFHTRRSRAIRRGSKKKSSRRLRLERFEDRCVPAIFMVTNTNDGGPGSLRSALFDAENTPNTGGPDEIHFNIPGDGVHTIFPIATLGLSPRNLPEIIDPVIIDNNPTD